jgi:tRNA U54 and U55 pseudouridine synthase Pus10
LKSDLQKAQRISSYISICDWCLGRQFSQDISRAKEFGASLVPNRPKGTCQLCRDAYDRICEITNGAIEALSTFEFRDFQVGVTIPKDAVDLEDELRAKFKLSTGVGIKKALVSLFRHEIGYRLGKPAPFWSPDVTVKIDVMKSAYQVESKSLSYLVRYVKLERGIPTRADTCQNCKGSGCNLCNGLRIDISKPSVELFVTREFIRAFEASSVRISWTGTEDDDALVLGNGRPIYVRLMMPKKRYSGLTRLSLLVGGPVQIVLAEQSEFSDQLSLNLRKLIRYRIAVKGKPAGFEAARIESSFRERLFHSVTRHGKKVYWFRVEDYDDSNVIALAEMDNGLSPWKLLKGGPSYTEDMVGLVDILGEANVTSVSYDIIDFR